MSDDTQPPAPQEDQSVSGRERLLRSLLHPSRAQVVVGVLLALLGFSAITQVHSSESADRYASLRQQDLIEVLGGLTGAGERARQELDQLQARRRDLESENRSRRAALEASQERLETLNILTGRVPVHGPGVVMTVTETNGRVRVSSLLDVVQELRTAGAEAIEFNNQVRVVAQSSFENGIGGIELHGVELSSPYVVEVIGDPHTLHAGLTFTSGPVEKLEEQDGATVEIREVDDVEIMSTRPAQRPEHAQADSDE